MRRVNTNFILKMGALLVSPLLAHVTAARAQGVSADLQVLAALQPGQWILRGLDSTSPSKTICIQDTRALLQIAHGRAQCSRFVISDTRSDAIVHYTCPGMGHGQTELRAETARLVQIQSQGFVNNEPFYLSYEARRIGECTASSGLSLHQR